VSAVSEFGTRPGGELRRLPLVTLYLTDRCNSRCITCDYWRTGRDNMSLEQVEALLPHFESMGTQSVLLSGGEPLLHPQWREIAALLRARGLRSWLLSSGLSLAKHAAEVARLFDSVTVSLDGTTAATYQAIRGLDAFDKVCEGIRAVAACGLPAGLRVTLQRANYRQMPEFVELARELGAAQVSFLAVDVGNPHAFGRESAFADRLALSPDDLPVFDRLVADMEVRLALEFERGFIAESPARLRRIGQYFAALTGAAEFPAVRCNAPEFSAVIGVRGNVAPCFFIPGPGAHDAPGDLPGAINSDSMRALRAGIRAGARPECARCVCSMWRDPVALAGGGAGFRLERVTA
jgi:MoaA/NifB/PqqE/SkfB family radical SAM enzyme